MRLLHLAMEQRLVIFYMELLNPIILLRSKVLCDLLYVVAEDLISKKATQVISLSIFFLLVFPFNFCPANIEHGKK